MPTFNGTSGNDMIFGSSTSDVINAYGGDDDIYGGGGDDFIDGGDGEDQIYGEGGNDEIDGGDGDDLIDGGDDDDTLTGGTGNDTLYGGAGSDTLTGGDGNDVLNGGADTDIAQGGDGDDIYFVDSSSDVVQENAAEGDDHVRSTALSYTLTANIERLTFIGTGNFTGVGNSGDNVLTGGTGNDTLIGGAGADTLNGDGGTDTASYATSSAAVTVNLTTGVNTGGDAQGDTLTGIENVTGSSFADTLTGDSGVNTLTGGAGNDTLNGGAGADTLIGGTGSSDTASYVTSSAGVTVNLTTGVHTGGDAAGDTLVAIENVTGSDHDDSLTGDNGANTLAGGGGDDMFYFAVGGAADRIDGGTETTADTLDITGTGTADAFFIETVADYNTRTGAGYAGLAEILVSVGSTVQTEVNEIETIAIHGGAGADTLTIPGSFTGTALTSSAFVFDAGTGDDTIDVSNRTSAHKVVADGGDEDTATGDVAILGFDFDDALSFERIEDGSGNLIGVKITHDIGGTPVTDEFTDFENFQFTDGTKMLEELSPLSTSFTSALGGHAELASLSSTGGQGNSGSSPLSISADGRYAVFLSAATTLVPGDTNGQRDIFVRDLFSGITTLASVDSSGAEANGDNSNASISADGRYVAFDSVASNLVSGDTNGNYDIFVRDLFNDTTMRVSVSSSGAQATGGSSNNPDISADGRYVVFQSFASNLVAGDTNAQFDVFVRDLIGDTTTRVSVNTAGAQATGGSSTMPTISADGRYVAFTSGASNLVASDTNSVDDVFVRDLVAGTTTRVSLSTGGTQANGNSGGASISSDGRYVVFASNASNLVTGDTNGVSDVFVRDRITGTTTRVSIDSTGSQGNGSSTLIPGSAISDDGRYVVFGSSASNLVAGDTNAQRDVFMHDLFTGITTLLSMRWDGTQTANSSDNPAISADGGSVLFFSPDEDLDPNDANFNNDTFALERALQWNEIALNVKSTAPTADTFKIEWGDGETTFHSLWGGAEQLVRHDYAANVSGTGTIHVMSGGSDIETTTFAVQTAPSGTSATSLTGTAGVDVLVGNDGANTLSGLGGNDMLSGGLGADTLDGGAGADNLRGGAGNDILTGGSSSDTFVFETGFGHDTITDFVAGAGTDDVIEFHNGIFADFAAVQAASSQVGSDVLITVDGSNSILLTNVTLANLHQDDFLFV